MIVINSALKQEAMIAFVEAFNPSIHFVKKQGISLLFEAEDEPTLAPQIKSALKSEAQFKALFFNVEVK